VFTLVSAGFLFVLFNFTTAGLWAEDLTASNRLLLQVMPALAYLLVALYAADRRGASSASA
jgi:Na+-translocating ferredoxin:NAD+ oxidoreductase RnfG subunit